MEKARVYFRVIRPVSRPPDGAPPAPFHAQESRVDFNESSIMRFVHDPNHHCEVIAVPEKTREAIDGALKQRFPQSIPVIELITWLT